jgi:hypothetical protein
VRPTFYENGLLENVSTNLDLLSYHAFFGLKVAQLISRSPRVLAADEPDGGGRAKVREALLHGRFTHWLPLYINSRHARGLGASGRQRRVCARAPNSPCRRGGGAVMAERQIAELCANQQLAARPQFKPSMALKVLAAAMNTFVVECMNGSLHHSLVALQGAVPAPASPLRLADSGAWRQPTIIACTCCWPSSRSTPSCRP